MVKGAYYKEHPLPAFEEVVNNSRKSDQHISSILTIHLKR